MEYCGGIQRKYYIRARAVICISSARAPDAFQVRWTAVQALEVLRSNKGKVAGVVVAVKVQAQDASRGALDPLVARVAEAYVSSHESMQCGARTARFAESRHEICLVCT